MIDSSKLQMPAAPHGVVARQRTNDLLDEAAERPVTVLYAPAGFGKTTAVLGWLESAPAAVAWLSLDAFDNDPARLGAHLMAALELAVPGLGADAGQALQAGSDLLTTCVPLLAEAVARAAPVDAVLVIDDYHVLTESACHELFRACVRALMPTVRTVVTSRSRPPLRLRASDIATLTAGDLAFRADETESLLNGTYGLGLTNAELRELDGRVHGWPVGLALLAASRATTTHARRRPELDQELSNMSRGTLADYVIQEILDQLAPTVRSFLLRTSILERLCGPLCVAVTGEAAAEELLEEAGTWSPTSVELGSGWRWTRIHDLIRNALRETLSRDEPDAVSQLHRRAAEWFAAAGMPAEAIAHATATGDGPFAARVLAENAEVLIEARQQATLRRALDALPVDRGDRAPFCDALDVRLMALSGAVDQGVARARAQELADRYPERSDVWRMTDPILVSPLAGDVSAAIAAGWVALGRHGLPSHARGQLVTQLALSLWFAGEFKAARGLVEPLAATDEPLTVAVQARTVLGMIDWSEGDHRRGQRLVTQALTLAAEAGAETAVEFVGIRAALAGALLQAGKLDEARVELDRDLGSGELLRPGSLAHALSLLLDARLALAERRRNRARSSLRRSKEMLDRFTDVGGTVELWLAQVEEALATPAEKTLFGTMPTPAEVRVLALLEEGLSRGEIADRLYLSDATVKSHLRRVYRRLGVTSRGSAVIAARRRGIVPTEAGTTADV